MYLGPMSCFCAIFESWLVRSHPLQHQILGVFLPLQLHQCIPTLLIARLLKIQVKLYQLLQLLLGLRLQQHEILLVWLVMQLPDVS